MTILIQRAEGATIALAAGVAFVHAGFAWWWLPLLFLIFDVSMIGYLRGPRVGALVYNVVHSYCLPVLVAAFAIATNEQWALFLAPLWLVHIGVDRLLGYGLKEPEGFQSTHLTP